MIKIENVEVYGFRSAIRGMRNPMNSWEKSDSWTCNCNLRKSCGLQVYKHCCKSYGFDGEQFVVGDNDLELATKLANAGSDHGKFLRMINVWFDLTAPVYWWAQLDTYKVGTVRDSCSFMHKGVSKPFELSDFWEDEETPALRILVEELNQLRDLYLETKDESYFIAIRKMLPQGYMVKSTMSMSYAVLKNIYHSRKNHRLLEWHEFCKFIESLPYAKELIIGE